MHDIKVVYSVLYILAIVLFYTRELGHVDLFVILTTDAVT